VKLPNFHKKGDAYYYVRGTAPRKWIPLGSNLALAIRRYDRMKAKGPAGTLGDLVDAWLASPPNGITPQTLHVYRTYAGNVARVFGELYPDEVGRSDVLRYLDECPRTTALHEISILRRVYERAIRAGIASANPCLGARPESYSRPKRDRLISEAELAAIRTHAPPLLQVAIDLAYATGLRPGDLCRLRWGDLETGVKTRKTGAWLRFEATDDLRAILEAAKALQGRIAVLTVLCERGRQTHPDRLRDLWQRACRDAGVENAQFRDIRAMNASADPENAQQRLGHASAQMTRTYLRGRQVSDVAPLKRKAT